MPAWNPLLTLPPRRYPLALLGALALSLGLGALHLALGRGPYIEVKTATAPADSKIEQYANWQDGRRVLAARFLDDLAFQTLARPYFCPGQTPRHFNFTAASLRKWHVACYEQLKHGRDVPRPALRR